MDDNSGDIPHSVTFTNTSTGTITGYSWDFGDSSPVDTTASPSHNYTVAGVYTVTLTVTGPGGSDQTTASVTANTAPTASNGSYTTPFETIFNQDISGLAGDVDAGDSLTFAIETLPSNGGASVNSDGTLFTYTPDNGFHGEDTVEFRVTDTRGSITTGTLTITVDPPLEITPVTSTPVPENGNNTIDVPAISSGTPDATTVTVVTDGLRGSSSVNPTTGVLTYTGDTDSYGADVVFVTIDDTGGDTSPVATLPIIIAEPLPTITGDTYYVDATGGSDSNDGLSSGAAKQTLSAVNGLSLSGGDGVLFKSGETFTGTLTLNSSSGGSGSNYVIVGSYGTGASPKIEAASNNRALDLNKNYVWIQELDFRANADILVQSDNVVFAYNYVASKNGSSPQGVDFRDTLSSTIRGNYIKGTGSGSGITGYWVNSTIERNVTEDMASHIGITGSASNVDVKQNYMFDTGVAGRAIFMISQYETATISDVDFFDNIIETGTAIDLQKHPSGGQSQALSSLSGVEFDFNTVRTSARAINTSANIVSEIALTNNIFQATVAGQDWLTSVGGSYTHSSSAPNIAHNYTGEPASFTDTDPLFVDATTHNFKLQPTSTGIDLAVASASGVDYTGAGRDSDPDYGALEYIGAWTVADDTPSVSQDDVYTGNATVLVSGASAIDSLTYSIQTQASDGIAAISSDGTTLTYIPEAYFNGADSFIIQVQDARGKTATTTISITVTAFDRSTVTARTFAFSDADAANLFSDTGKTTIVTDTDTIAAYTDLSGSGHDLPQASGTQRPTWTDAGGAIFTRAGAASTDTDFLSFNPAAITSGGTGYTIYARASITALPAFTDEGHGIYGNNDGDDNENPHLMILKDNIIEVGERGDGHKYTYVLTPNQLHDFAVRTDGVMRELWIDGVKIGSNLDSNGLATIVTALWMFAARWFLNNKYALDGRGALFEVYNEALADNVFGQVMNDILQEVS